MHAGIREKEGLDAGAKDPAWLEKVVEIVGDRVKLLPDILPPSEFFFRGVEPGEAPVGSLGTRERRDYTAIGNTVNIAAGLCSVCPPDRLNAGAAVPGRLPYGMRSRFAETETLRLKGRSGDLLTHPFTSQGGTF